MADLICSAFWYKLFSFLLFLVAVYLAHATSHVTRLVIHARRPPGGAAP